MLNILASNLVPHTWLFLHRIFNQQHSCFAEIFPQSFVRLPYPCQISIRNNKRTPCSRFLHEKLMRPQLAKKFPTFYGTRWFITPFTRTLHLSLSWVRLIQSLPLYQRMETHFNIIHLCVSGFSKWLVSFRFPHQKPCKHFPLPHVPHAPPIAFFLSWTPEKYLVRGTDHIAAHHAVYSTSLLPRFS
jgi:hypothetical protein